MSELKSFVERCRDVKKLDEKDWKKLAVDLGLDNEKKEERIIYLEDKIQKILNWCNAYPLDVFPEPDLKKAARILKENGMTLDSISASNMRHVLEGIKEILEKTDEM